MQWLHSIEAYTNIPFQEIERLEQFDMAALRTRIGGVTQDAISPFVPTIMACLCAD